MKRPQYINNKKKMEALGPEMGPKGGKEKRKKWILGNLPSVIPYKVRDGGIGGKLPNITYIYHVVALPR
jgi:hypothetical protein